MKFVLAVSVFAAVVLASLSSPPAAAAKSYPIADTPAAVDSERAATNRPADSAPTVASPDSPSALARWIALVFGGTALLGAIRAIQDVRDNRSLAIPAAGATGDSESIFIGTGPHVENLEVQILIPVLPDLVDAKTVIATLQDSADNASFAALAELAPVTALGAGGIGFAGSTTNFRLPSDFRGYLRMHVATLAAAGDNTGVEIQLNLLQ